MNLTTRYLGLELEHPLVPSASPLTGNLDSLKELEDCGASMVVLHSLFEEQIEHDAQASEHFRELGTDSFSESLSYFPDSGELDHGVGEYLDLVRKAKESLSIPVVASLNGTQTGGWTESAKQIEEAGADALELNIYFIATSLDDAGDTVEKRYMDILKSIKSSIQIPVTVKLSPYFSSLGHLARQLVENGADGLVLFNRSYLPDIQIEELEHQPHLNLSDSDDLKLPLHWLSILYGRIPCDLSATSGIHTVEDVVKATMAGASVTHLCSALLQNGPGLLGKLKSGLITWLEEHEYDSLGQMLGSMSFINCPDPSALERANYMKTLMNWTPQK
jgi:dihydroorotate dehydrogenase (fumarate)